MGSAQTTKTMPQPLTMIEARIIVSIEPHAYLLNDGRMARQALSCLIRPEVGDLVLTSICQNDTYILHILQRNELQQAQLSVPGITSLHIEQEQLSLAASDSIALRALNNVELTAASGVLSLNARNLFSSVQDSLVQNVGHFIGKAEHYLLEVKQLLRLHSQQALITAEEDVKVDGERISMG